MTKLNNMSSLYLLKVNVEYVEKMLLTKNANGYLKYGMVSNERVLNCCLIYEYHR